MLETSQMKTEAPQGQTVPKACDFQSVQVAKQGHGTFFVHKRINGVFEMDRVVFLQGTGLQPNLMQGYLLLCPDEPVDAALESVAFALPTGGNPTRSSGMPAPMIIAVRMEICIY